MKEDKKKVFIRTMGCQMNVRDSEVISGLLKADHWQLVSEPEEADVVIFNTCSVRQHAEDKVWSEIGRVSKFSTRPMIGICGCMAQNYKEAVFERAPSVDFVVGPSDISKIPQIIKQLVSKRSVSAGKGIFESKIWETEGEVRPEEIYHTRHYDKKDHAFVVISEGCSNFCSYCVVPFVRGRLRSRRHKDILREIEEAAGSGIACFTLLGQNVNAYKDGEVDFAGLLSMIEKVKGLKKFGFITSHPKDTDTKLFEALRNLKKFDGYLHLPVQSGSDKILKLMNRGYTRKIYLDLADSYRKIIPDGILTSDIIVGFPGETEEDFRDSYDLIKSLELNAAFIFKYSPRPHTSASNLADDVAKQEKERRHALILDLQKSISKKKGKR